MCIVYYYRGRTGTGGGQADRQAGGRGLAVVLYDVHLIMPTTAQVMVEEGGDILLYMTATSAASACCAICHCTTIYQICVAVEAM